MDFDVERFIYEIEKRPAIWNTKGKEYSDKILKIKMWEELVNLFGGKDMLVDEKKKLGSSVQKKWKNIRDNFVKEYRRRIVLKNGSSVPHKQTYIYYNQLMFLKDVVASNKRDAVNLTSTLELQQDTDEQSSEEEDKTTTPNTTYKSSRKKKRKAGDAVNDDVLEGTTCDVKPIHSELTRWSSRVKQSSCLPVSNSSGESVTKRRDSFASELSQDAVRPPVETGGLARVVVDDKFDAFGKNVAAKLRSLANNEQRIFAEKLINDALFEAELGTLSRRSSIDVGNVTGSYYPEVECNISSVDSKNLVEQL